MVMATGMTGMVVIGPNRDLATLTAPAVGDIHRAGTIGLPALGVRVAVVTSTVMVMVMDMAKEMVMAIVAKN